jgi:hypothetical protein
MGTSFAEAVRIFAAKSLMVNGLPFQMTAAAGKAAASVSDLAGSLREYATPEMLAGESAALHSAFANAAIAKHERLQ